MYLSLDDKDFDDMARHVTRHMVKFYLLLAGVFVLGAGAGALVQEWLT